MEKIMYTFLEYVAVKKCDNVLQEVCTEVENNPILQKALIREGVWDTIKNAGQAVEQFAQGAWSGGGIKAGGQAAWSQMTGPATQFQAALTALTKARDAIDKNPEWKQSKTFSGKSPLLVWLNSVLGELQQQQKQFQNLQLKTGQGAVAAPAPRHGY
jgi:hypothetical protein